MLNVVSACPLGVVLGMRYPEQRADLERSFRVLRSLPADIWVTSRARPWGRYRKFVASARAKNPVDPFIDPEGYRAYIDTAESEFRQRGRALAVTRVPCANLGTLERDDGQYRPGTSNAVVEAVGVETVVSPRFRGCLPPSITRYCDRRVVMALRIDVVPEKSDRKGTTGPYQQGRWDVIRIATAAVMVTWMAATGAPLAGQDLQINTTEPAAIRVSVETLSRHVLQFAGLRVQVADAVVDRVVSPRAFLLVGQRDVAGLGGRERVGVVLASGTAVVVKKMPVIVTGAAGTFVGAQVFGILTRSEALTEEERDGLSRYPLVLALSVETPGDINLIREAPTTPTTAK